LPQPRPPSERCYDCGGLIPEGEIVRTWAHVSTYHGPGLPVERYGKVSLCPRCAEQWKKKQRRDRAVLLLGALICFLVAPLVVAIGIGCFWAAHGR
jgi:predicted nucleic acid-binding Zn ribbon protein